MHVVLADGEGTEVKSFRDAYMISMERGEQEGDD